MHFTILFLLAFSANAFSAAIESNIAASKPIDPRSLSITSRIVNGQPAATNQFPWQVSIRAKTEQYYIELCGGSLIHPSWVLTAGHCTERMFDFEISLGSNYLNQPTIKLAARRVILHPGYNSKNLNNDLAVIQLISSVQLTPNIQTIRLPQRSHHAQSFIGSLAIVSGYGLTSDGGSISNQLNYVGISIISNKECVLIYGQDVIIQSTICGRGADVSSQSTCSGDSGGPLVIKEVGDDEWTQIGVVSFVSEHGCSVGQPSGYSRTSQFVDWIAAVTGISIRE